MSSAATPHPASSSPPPAAKPRSPLERAIVWGVIAIGVVLIGVEGLPKWQHYNAATTLTNQMRASDEGDTVITKADVTKALGGRLPARVEDQTDKGLMNAAKTLEVYTWFTFSPTYKRELYVY